MYFRITIALLLIICASSCGSARDLTRPGHSNLPVLPDTFSQLPEAAKQTSAGEFHFDLTTPIAEAGNANRVDPPGVVLADQAAIPWRMYGVTMTGDERPVSLNLDVESASVSPGGELEPLTYWVGVSNYSSLAWEWKGPYSADADIVLNNDPAATVSPRRVSATLAFYFVIVAAPALAELNGPHAIKLDAATLTTADDYEATLPHAVVSTAVQGNTKGPAGPDDIHALTVEWQPVLPASALDEQNAADTYFVFRSSSIGSSEQIGSVVFPDDKYLDPVDNDANVSPPLPGANYRYWVEAANESGRASTGNRTLVQCANPAIGSVWDQYRANPQHTGSVASVALAGTLQETWDEPLFPAPSENSYEPLIDANGDVLIVNGTHVNRYAFSDGSENLEKGNFSPMTGDGYAARLGTLLAFPDETSGIQTVSLGGAASKTFAGSGRVRSAPLLLNKRCIFADAGGSVNCYDTSTGTLIWQDPGSDEYELAPVTDFEFVYAINKTGRLHKLRLSDGGIVGELELGRQPVGESLALDIERGILWLPTIQDALVAISTEYMVELENWPSVGGNTGVAPCIVGYANPPLVVTAYRYSSNEERVLAVNAESLVQAWELPLPGAEPDSVSASADMLFLCRETMGTGSELVTLTFGGAVSQYISMPDSFGGSVVPSKDHLLVALRNDPSLRQFESSPVSRPVWQDPNQEGISGWAIDGEETDLRDDLRASWYTAIHPDGLAVHYALFYAVGHAPMLDPPYTDTGIIAGLTNADRNTVMLSDQPLAQRYYASVRAYIGTWGVDALTDLNTVTMGCTPPWAEGGLNAGSSLLPSGKTTQFAITADDLGRAKVIALSESSGTMWHYYYVLGFGAEGPWINSYNADACAVSWFDTTYAARAKPGVLSVFKRNNANDWTLTELTGRDPDPTPALSFSINDQSAISWTQKVGGSEPTTQVDYYAARNTTGTWGASEIVDDTNAGGSDLSLVLDPADHTRPWIAYQRGTLQAGTFPTCTRGELWYATGDGSGDYSLELVDAGENSPASDCGKRVRQVLDVAGYPHLAYLDLNAAATEPKGRLKYAYKDAGGWHIENIYSFDLSAQSGDAQFTYGEVGLMLEGNEPRLALLERQDFDPAPGSYIHVIARVFSKRSGNWQQEQVSDSQPVLLKDREPCNLVPDGNGNFDLYYIAKPYGSTAEPGTQMPRLIHVN